MKTTSAARCFSFFLGLSLLTTVGLAQESIKADVKIKVLSSEETLASGFEYRKSEDIRKIPDAQKAYFHVLNSLSTTISLENQIRKWEIISGLIAEHRTLDLAVLFERFLISDNEIKEAIALAIWKKSITEKNKSILAMEFLEAIKERAEEGSEGNLHDSISAFFLIEAVTQMIVNDESASSIYFMISEPEETVELNDEGDLVTSFDFSPLGYLADYYSQDFKEDLLAEIINGMFKIKSEAFKPPLKRSEAKLMVTGHIQRDSFLINNTKKKITFHIVSTSGALYKNLLKPGRQHGFIFQNDSQTMRIKSEDGKEYEIKPYKKYHFEEN